METLHVLELELVMRGRDLLYTNRHIQRHIVRFVTFFVRCQQPSSSRMPPSLPQWLLDLHPPLLGLTQKGRDPLVH